MEKLIFKRLYIISNLIMLLLLYFALNQIIYLVSNINNDKGDFWLSADWLINYSNGFIRRGLSGEILALLANLLNINLINLTSYVQASLMVLFITFSIFLYLKTSHSFVEKMLLCSPAFYIGFSYWTYRAAFRKELLLVTIFATLLLLIHPLKTKKICANHYLTVAIFFFAVFAPIHEMIIFYCPFFIFLFVTLYYTHLIDKKIVAAAVVLFSLLSIVALILSYFYHGDNHSWKIICSSLTFEKSDNFCNGAIYATSQNLAAAIANTKYNAIYGDYLIYYPICCLLAFFPFIFVTYAKTLPIKKFVIISIIFIIPLFIVGYDWGRWISTYITLFTLLVFYLIQMQQAYIRPICYKHPMLFFIIFLLYIFSWIIPHCCTYPKLGYFCLLLVSFF